MLYICSQQYSSGLSDELVEIVEMGWKHRIELSKCVCAVNYIQKGKQNQLVCTQQHVHFYFLFHS